MRIYSRVSSLRDRRESYKDLAQYLAASLGCHVDPATVQRCLVRNGLCGRVGAKTQHVQKGDKVELLEYAKIHRDWNEDQWGKRILWSDGAKFEMLGSSC